MEFGAVGGIIINVIIVTIAGGVIRYYFGKLKAMEDKVCEIMPAKEIRSLIDMKVDEKLELIRYILAEIKDDLREIKKQNGNRSK